ncbi:MAG: methionine--tRNA ligase [Planctomycetota bacterium]
MTHESFYVTTPIYYVNDRPHIGHVFTTVLADCVARHHRLLGERVFFLTGTDEHATKVVDAAKERGLTTQAWADQNAKAFRDTFERLGFTHDDFIRTSEERHKSRVTAYVKTLLDSGDVYLGDYEGWYDAGQEEYVPEAKAKKLDYTSPINKKPLVRKSEKNYYFRLSRYAEQLQQLIQDDVFHVRPEARKNEVLGRIAEGLEDVPISRTGVAGWGITVPGDDAHTIYVWIDALLNYLTTVDTDERRALWPATVQYVGKDILWFHAVIWPALLLALGQHEAYAWVELPGTLYAHSFWTSEGAKMSKSLGNFIDLERLDGYVADYGLDALRWFLITQGPTGTTDSDFSADRFREVYNADLANTLGNCLNRVVNMTQRYFGGHLPAPGPEVEGAQAVRETTEAAVKAALAAFQDLRLDEAASQGLGVVRAIDGFIERTQPFKLAKDEAQRPAVGTILGTCAEALRVASLLLWPLLPEKCAAIWERLGCAHYAEQLAAGEGQLQAWSAWGQLKPGTPISGGEGLFPRKQPPKEAPAPKPAAKAKPKAKKEKAPPPGPAAEVAFEDFAALDLRIATVKAASAVEKADRLLQLTLELADGETRTVLSGIRAWYEPEALVGRQVVYLANLAPRKIRGVLSQGMVLAGNDVGDAAVLLRAEREVAPGSKVS